MQGRTSVSTPITLMDGRSAFAATATPDTSPPPPIGTTIASVSGSCASTSSAIVPWPAMTSGSSNGCTKVSPSVCSSRRASAYASS